MTDQDALVPLATPGRLLTAAEFQRLADIPPEIEWFANLTNKATRRVYEAAVQDLDVIGRDCGWTSRASRLSSAGCLKLPQWLTSEYKPLVFSEYISEYARYDYTFIVTYSSKGSFAGSCSRSSGPASGGQNNTGKKYWFIAIICIS